MNDRVTITIEDHVADVRLNRPDKMNALDDAMFEGLVAMGERLKQDRQVRAVVLSGEGKAFCAGLDMGSFAQMAQGERSRPPAPGATGRLHARTHGLANRPQYAAWVWREVPVPVIAAVHGVTLGGGFQVALGCDMRFMTPDARLAVLEMKWGLVPDMAGIALMRELARADVVRELTYSARMFSGEEALGFGFATRVCTDPRAEALALAHEIAEKNPDAVRAAKRLLNAAFDDSAAEVLQAESDEQDQIIGAPNQIEAVMAALAKRKAQFSAG